MTKAEDRARAHYHRMAEGLRRLEMALHGPARGTGAVPEAWHGIAQSAGPGRKTRVTLWVEVEVLEFFRAMGAGHTTRMAEVLATFRHARLAGVVKGPEDVAYDRPLLSPEAEAAAAAREAQARALMARLDRSRPALAGPEADEEAARLERLVAEMERRRRRR